jgi:hypothetical protein
VTSESLFLDRKDPRRANDLIAHQNKRTTLRTWAVGCRDEMQVFRTQIGFRRALRGGGNAEVAGIDLFHEAGSGRLDDLTNHDTANALQSNEGAAPFINLTNSDRPGACNLREAMRMQP